MAADFITINGSGQNKPLGRLAVNIGNLLVQLQSALAQANNAVGHSNDGITWTTVETNFGLAGGTGANFATLVGLLNTIFNTNAEVTGANRLSQINEYVGRVAGQ